MDRGREADVGTKGGSAGSIPSTSDAVEALHVAFSERRRPSRLDAAPTRDPAEVAKLLAASLREADVRAILRYSASAMTTIGTEEDFAYFLPRILDEAIEGPSAGLAEPFIIADKLEMADWRSWTPAERTAVENALLSAFIALRTVDPDDGEAFPWLEAMMRAGVDPRPVIETWPAASGPAPLRQLASCLLALARRVERGEFDDCRREIVRELVDWFSSDAVERAIVERAGEVPPDRAHLLDRAVDAIPALARSSYAGPRPPP